MDKSLKSTIDNQKNYFKSKKTYNVDFRIQKLKDLLNEIKSSEKEIELALFNDCLLYTYPSPRDRTRSRMPSSA